MINFEYPPLGGGGGVATHDIARELAKRHNVHVLTTAFRDLPYAEVLGNVTIHRVRVFGRTTLPTATFLSLITFAPAAFFAGIRIMMKMKFDVLYALFVIPSGLPAVFLSKLFRVPFVLTFIGGDIYDPSKGISPHRHILLRAIIRFIASSAKALTAISHDTKTRTIELHGVTQEITVVPIGLMPKDVPSASRAQLGYLEDDIICVSIGRLVPRKGYDILLKAWQNIPDAKLVIIGNGPLKAELAQHIQEYGLTDRVQLLGQVDEQQKLQILLIADMYVSAAQHEGFGIVFLEAMHAGLPIIAANDGGQTDFLTDGEHAFLLPPHDFRAISRAVIALIQNKELRIQMGRKNKEAVQEYYLDRTVARIEKILTNAGSAV
ncbi:MAG TPA: glycosyltransferase family 4 protein [Candidatus Andersenbacteria bacterium]|nr:glycosyltransferase family 4 protein [Candidatus Andersenbacteria bacterium]